ncbi:hypothetical protein QFZ20_000321 [Flavobacterium sp. W4I14]|nr:hypothetical protein [Flavobacterium sp. W4I14]
MRKGKILSVDPAGGHGLIEDENEQEIKFILDSLSIQVDVTDEVKFEIAMGICGLIAVDLMLL